MNKSKFPQISKAIEMLALDNNMILLSEPVWPEIKNLQDIEENLKSLTDDELDIFCCGEQSEAEKIARVKMIDWKTASDFLNEVFDGNYYGNFCRTN
jgi:hypothetical protein